MANINDVPCGSCATGYDTAHACDVPDRCPCDRPLLHTNPSKLLTGHFVGASSGLDAIRKAREGVQRDDFAVGDVIRWTMTYPNADKVYVYAALKTPVGWFTTSRAYGHVPQGMDFQSLVEVLASPGAAGIEYATAWSSIDR